MNIHEHQAKQILKEFGIQVPNGIFGFSVEEIVEKAKELAKRFNKLKLERQMTYDLLSENKMMSLNNYEK